VPLGGKVRRLPPGLHPDAMRRARILCTMEKKAAASVDLNQFRQYVEHCDLSDEQKMALLEDLWSIVQSFVDEAWGLCPTQFAANENQQNTTVKALEMLDYPHADNASDKASPQEKTGEKGP